MYSRLAFGIATIFALISTASPAMVIRSLDGTFNNALNPDWGAADTPLLRKTAPAYEDGMSEPRGGNPSNLISPREISNAVSAQTAPIYNTRRASDWLWQWGQFLDHDLDLTDPQPSGDPFNIPVPAGDSFFDRTNSGTAEIKMQRSLFENDGAGVRQQINQITSFIDASNVYGSDQERAAMLRADDGFLRMSTGLNGEVLMGKNDIAGHPPLANAMPHGAQAADFFLGGDVRVNEQIGLTAVHTLFAREHNRIAENLTLRLGSDPDLIAERDATMSRMGGGFSEGDFIYEAARKVVGAQIQKITYAEFIPLFLGVDLIAGSPLYDERVNPAVSNEFSAAAFRVGHTMLPPTLWRADANGLLGPVALRDAFFNPAEIMKNGVDSLLLGLASQQAQAIDTLLVDDVRNFLFGPPAAGGFDLASLNLQRGRDHGIDTLNNIRIQLNLPRYDDFMALTGGDADLADALERVYGKVDEVDLWIGGLAETEHDKGMVGETFAYILEDQFKRLMLGDRFFFTNPNEMDVLEILDPGFMQHTSLASVIRRNSGVLTIQDNAFLVVPEPGTLVLLGGAFVLMRTHRRRR